MAKYILTNKILLLSGSLFIAGCILHNKTNGQPQQTKYSTVMVVSVSSDGNYTVSSDTQKRLILWDIQHKTTQIIANDVNIYSAYFVKDTDKFMYQDDKSNQVIIENTAGKIVQSFDPGFATYGQVITKNLQHYFASDEGWNLFHRDNKQQQKIAHGHLSFLGIGKLLNLTLSNDQKQLLLSGDGGDSFEKIPLSKSDGKVNLNGVVLWSLHPTIQPFYKLPGNVAKTIATLSPDGKYVVSGDEGGGGFVFSTTTGKKLFALDSILFGKYIKTGPDEDDAHYDDTGLKKPPPEFHDWLNQFRDLIFALKFIDNTHYLRFTTDVPYAILYNVLDPKPQKYFPLGTDPYPMINEYSADEAIDTAPAAHILVMGQSAKGSGIIVYRYDPKDQTLTKIWAPPGP